MKLFLSSMAISPVQASDFMKLVGKEARDTRIALIENAADPETGDKSWVWDSRKAIQNSGSQIEIIDLNNYKEGKKNELRRSLEKANVIWLGGGNTYYLRWILKETGADKMIKDLAEQGKIYGGGSAGAVMAGPTLKFFEAADDPKEAPEYITNGLGLTRIVVVPHWQSADYGSIIADVANNLRKAGHSVVTITDDQALVIDGDTERIIG